MTTIRKVINTPFLPMMLVSDGKNLLKSRFLFKKETGFKIPNKSDDIIVAAEKQLKEYFKKKRKTFDLPLAMPGTDFQRKVWQALQDIPYGEVSTYKNLAEEAGSPKAFRAAGGACRANHFMIIVPCHRVLGSNGALTGYSGDKTFIKQYLLDLEKGLSK